MTAQTPEKNRQTQMARLPHDTRERNSTLWCEHCETVVKRHNVSVFMQPFSASRLLHSKSTFHAAKTQRGSTFCTQPRTAKFDCGPKRAPQWRSLNPQTRYFIRTEWLSTTNRSLHSCLTFLRLSHKRKRKEHKLRATEKQTTHQRQRTGLTVIATSSTCTDKPVNSSGIFVNLSECSELCLVSW